MSTIILTSVHIFVALLTTTAAIFLLISNFRNTKARAVGILLIVFALSSFAFGFELNALSTEQVIRWVIIEFFVAYATPAASFLVALYILRPNLTKKLWITIPLWILILYPLVIGLMDISGISNAFFNSHIFFNAADIADSYTGGYLSVGDAGSGPYYQLARVELIGLFAVFMVYPSLFVFIKDRKTNPLNSQNALLILIMTIVTAVFQTVLTDLLPPTIATIIANLSFSIGFFIAGYRTISAESGQAASFQNLFQNYPMGYKLSIAMAAIIIPTIIFIGFTTYSFFQTSLLSVSNQNIFKYSEREANLITTVFKDNFVHLDSLPENAELQALLEDRQSSYASLTPEQIDQQITENEQLWQNGDEQLVSTIMAPENSAEILRLLEEFPEITNIIIVDQNGALLAAGETPDHYSYTTTSWWDFTSSNQGLFIGNIQFDSGTETFSTTQALPIVDGSGQYIGSIYASYNLNEIVASINASKQETVNFGFANTSLVLPMHNPATAEMISLPAPSFTYTRSAESTNTVQLLGQAYILKLANIAGEDMQFSAPWWIVAYQPVDEALAPLTTARNGTIATSAIIVAISAAVVIGLTRSLTQPLSELSEAAEQILKGNRHVAVNITSKDELGTLSTTFNQMASQISSMVEGLENTIEARTKDLERRAVQLEASALVAQQANEIQDLTTLLDQTVELVSEKFGYYHAGIFLVDEQRKYAVLEAANSEGGKRMLARGHKLQVGRVGVVGYCAGMGEPRIAQDVGADITYYDNPDMPHTRSEMALPMIVNEQVIGVIDVQSTEASAFTQDDIDVLQVLANQIALAIEKARLLETSQKALEELQRLYGQEAALAWKQKLTGEEIAYQYSSTGFTKMLLDSQQTVSAAGNQLNKEIKYRGQVIGSLDFIRDDLEGKWTEEEEVLIEEILEQTALALENARLVDQIKLRSDQITLLQQITAMAASTLDETELLNQVSAKLQTSLLLDQCGVVLFDRLNQHARLTASSPEIMKPAGSPTIPLDEDPYFQQGEHPGTEAILIHELQGAPKYNTFTHTFNVEISNSLILLPIAFREEAIGYIFLAEQEPDRKIDPEEHNLYRQIQAQVSTAVESARLFAAEQQGREASAALLEITQISSASLDINEVLNEATYRSAEAIQANRCTILLLDEREKIKPLISVYKDGTQMEDDEWNSLVVNIRATYKNVPMRTLAASLRTPRYIDSPITYEQFPLGWTHHFDIEKILMVPLISQNKVIGTMVYDLTSRDQTFTESQVELAQTIAGQIATTLENANLFDQAVRRAERERQVTEITAKIRASNDPKQILDTAISELRLALAKHDLQEKQKATSTNKPTSFSNGKDNL